MTEHTDTDASTHFGFEEVRLGETVDKQFTMVADVAEVALMLAAFKTNALTGESIIVSHGWHMN